MTERNLSMKQKQTGEQTCGCQGGGVWGRDGVGGGGEQVSAVIHGGDKQPEPTAQHGELYSMSSDKP